MYANEVVLLILAARKDELARNDETGILYCFEQLPEAVKQRTEAYGAEI